MREVQLAMMARPATAHPYYWASFLVAGEASPIPSDANAEPAKSGSQKPGAALPPGANGCACEVAGPSGAGEGAPLSVAVGALALAIARLRKRVT
jgi:hypothetical protein